VRFELDRASDTLYIRLNERPIEDSELAEDGVIIDYDAEGRVVAIEVLNVSRRTGAAELPT
jgi:uncharacterized protein YuzE